MPAYVKIGIELGPLGAAQARLSGEDLRQSLLNTARELKAQSLALAGHGARPSDKVLFAEDLEVLCRRYKMGWPETIEDR